MLEDLLEYSRSEGRVCPQPQRWNELWDLLPERRRVGGGWEPPLPLILGAWWETTSSEKADRLSLHLAYAAANGIIDKVDAFLRSLTESEWAHESDFGAGIQ